MGRKGHGICPEVGPGGWGSSSGKTDVHLFFQLVWVALVTTGSADVEGQSAPWGGYRGSGSGW